MMIRQTYTDNYKKIALYCNFLEYKANEYEYITYIMNDNEFIDYYTMETDETHSTYIVYFYVNEEDVEKVHNVKVVAKLKGQDKFEVGTLYVQSEVFLLNDTILDKTQTTTFNEYGGVIIPENIEQIQNKLEVVSIG